MGTHLSRSGAACAALAVLVTGCAVPFKISTTPTTLALRSCRPTRGSIRTRSLAAGHDPAPISSPTPPGPVEAGTGR